MRVLVAPSEVVFDQPGVRQLRDAAIEGGMRAQKQGELRARLAGQNRIVLPQLTSESVFLGVEQQRDFVALRVSVNDTEPAVHQALGCRKHYVYVQFIERGIIL